MKVKIIKIRVCEVKNQGFAYCLKRTNIIKRTRAVNSFNREMYTNMQNQPVCKIQSVGIDNFVRCLEDDPKKCPYALPLGSACFCRSPHLSCHEQGSLRTTREHLSKNHREEGAIAV